MTNVLSELDLTKNKLASNNNSDKLAFAMIKTWLKRDETNA